MIKFQIIFKFLSIIYGIDIIDITRFVVLVIILKYVL